MKSNTITKKEFESFRDAAIKIALDSGYVPNHHIDRYYEKVNSNDITHRLIIETDFFKGKQLYTVFTQFECESKNEFEKNNIHCNDSNKAIDRLISMISYAETFKISDFEVRPNR